MSLVARSLEVSCVFVFDKLVSLEVRSLSLVVGCTDLGMGVDGGVGGVDIVLSFGVGTLSLSVKGSLRGSGFETSVWLVGVQGSLCLCACSLLSLVRLPGGGLTVYSISDSSWLVVKSNSVISDCVVER